VLLEVKLRDGDGEELLAELSGLRPLPAAAVLSSHIQGERALRLLSKGIWPIPKPIDGPTLVRLVDRLCARHPARDWVGAYCRARGLSGKEAQLVHASGEGLRGIKASERLGCKLHSTTTLWQRIFRKTGCRSQPAVAFAILSFALGHGRVASSPNEQ
jgi:DNA-binding CsgD family transcriptional regulator